MDLRPAVAVRCCQRAGDRLRALRAVAARCRRDHRPVGRPERDRRASDRWPSRSGPEHGGPEHGAPERVGRGRAGLDRVGREQWGRARREPAGSASGGGRWPPGGAGRRARTAGREPPAWDGGRCLPAGPGHPVRAGGCRESRAHPGARRPRGTARRGGRCSPTTARTRRAARAARCPHGRERVGRRRRPGRSPRTWRGGRCPQGRAVPGVRSPREPAVLDVRCPQGWPWLDVRCPRAARPAAEWPEAGLPWAASPGAAAARTVARGDRCPRVRTSRDARGPPGTPGARGGRSSAERRWTVRSSPVPGGRPRGTVRWCPRVARPGVRSAAAGPSARSRGRPAARGAGGSCGCAVRGARKHSVRRRPPGTCADARSAGRPGGAAHLGVRGRHGGARRAPGLPSTLVNSGSSSRVDDIKDTLVAPTACHLPWRYYG